MATCICSICSSLPSLRKGDGGRGGVHALLLPYPLLALPKALSLQELQQWQVGKRSILDLREGSIHQRPAGDTGVSTVGTMQGLGEGARKVNRAMVLCTLGLETSHFTSLGSLPGAIFLFPS